MDPLIYSITAHTSLNSAAVARLVDGEVGRHDRPRRHMNLHVNVKFQRHYSSSSLSATGVGAGIADQYLLYFLNLALYHLLQIVGVYHGDIKRHLSLF